MDSWMFFIIQKGGGGCMLYVSLWYWLKFMTIQVLHKNGKDGNCIGNITFIIRWKEESNRIKRKGDKRDVILFCVKILIYTGKFCILYFIFILCVWAFAVALIFCWSWPITSTSKYVCLCIRKNLFNIVKTSQTVYVKTFLLAL